MPASKKFLLPILSIVIYLCRDCHKKHNKKAGEKAAPTSCKQCHPPKKKK